MGGIANPNCYGIDADFLPAVSACPIGAGNPFSMSSAGGSESVGPHLMPCPDGSGNEPGPQLVMAWVCPDSPISPPPAAVGRFSQGDSRADSVGNLQQVGLSSSILLSTSADVLRPGCSTSCTLLPSSPSPRPPLAPLPQHLASIFAVLTNSPPASSRPSPSAESHLDLPSILGSAHDCDRNCITVGLTDTTNGPGADELGLMGLGSPQSTITSKSVPLIMDSSAGIALSSGDQDALLIVEGGKLEKTASEMDQELLEEGELEDGELSGGWENGEEEDDDDDDDAAGSTDPLNFRDGRLEEGEAEEEDEEEAIVDYRTEGLTPIGMRFGVDGRINQAAVGGSGNQFGKDHLKNSKRRKGKGALSRQRKRSRLEKAQKVSNEPIIDVSVDGRQQGGHVTSTTRVESPSAGRNAGGKQQQSGCNTVEADAGPEEGEVIEEDNRGLLSQLVEEEVGLWTTDVGDEQITSSKVDSDEDGKKRVRAPMTAERKLKKKVAFRRKRAEKEKELGIRRPRLPVSTFKPKVPLCKFYVKGRCTLGANCTFSHDVVPITKSDPCKFFMVNRCLKGDDCPFSHSLDTFPCKFWHTRGHCLDGSNCRFSHGPLSDDQRQNLAKRIEHDSKEQLNVLDISTDFNNAPEDSESEYMPTVNNGQNEALGWDVIPPQALNQDTTCHASTSMTSHSVPNNRQAPSAALRTSFGGNQSSIVLGEVDREEIQLTDTHREDTPAENAVLLAARKAASAAAVQAAGTTDKLFLSRSGSVTGISLPKSRSFGRSLPSRGPEASAMDLLRASISNDDGRDLSGNAHSSQAVSKTGPLSALVSCSASAGGDMVFPLSSPLSRAAPSSLARGSSFGYTRQAVVPGSKGSAMELLQASLGNEATRDESNREVDLPGL